MVDCKKQNNETCNHNSSSPNNFIKYLLSSHTIIPLAIEELVSLDVFTLPQDKLKCVERSCQIIVNALQAFHSSNVFISREHNIDSCLNREKKGKQEEENDVFGADEFLPAYILVVLNLLLHQPQTVAEKGNKVMNNENKYCVKENGFEEGLIINSIYADVAYMSHYHHDEGLRGRQGYYLTCFESAVEFIRLYKIDKKDETDKQ